MSSLSHKRAILDYWTLVEFFSPYLLGNSLDSQQHDQRVFADEYIHLPWMAKPPLDEHDPSTTQENAYHLYLGIFSIEETGDRARHVFCEKPSEWQSINWRQCVSSATMSCFGRITLTQFGSPLFGTLTLSTLTWAHGRLLSDEKQFLALMEPLASFQHSSAKSQKDLVLNLIFYDFFGSWEELGARSHRESPSLVFH